MIFEDEVVLVDETSFDKLYQAFIEAKADKEMEEIKQEQSNASNEEDEDISISEFLRNFKRYFNFK